MYDVHDGMQGLRILCPFQPYPIQHGLPLARHYLERPNVLLLARGADASISAWRTSSTARGWAKSGPGVADS